MEPVMRPRMRPGLYSDVSVRATGGSAMPNSAKSQASNITPKKHSANRLRCQREKGSRSSRPTSSADFSAVVAIGPLPGGTLILVSIYSPRAREVNNEASQNDKRSGSFVPSPLVG